MIVSIKKWSELTTNYQDIIDYINEKFADITELFNEINNNYTYTLSKIQDLQSDVSIITDKVSEDALDRINNLGTIEDFSAGIIDGMNSANYGTSLDEG